MPVEEFNEKYFSPLLKKITSESKDIYLTGDFNINLLNTETDEPTASFLNNLTCEPIYSSNNLTNKNYK